MGGFDTIAWLAVGGAAAWVFSRLRARKDDDSLRGPPAELRFTRPDAAVESAQSGATNREPPLTYAAARDQLVEQLLSDAMAHDAGRYQEIGQHFDRVEAALPHEDALAFRKVRVAMAFWDGWIDARNAGWDGEGDIARSEWPLLARTVAADLVADRDVTDARIVAHFDAGVYPSLGARMQTLAARLRAG